MTEPRPIRAFCLLSGGLDSRLAVCVLRDQGIEVQGLSFDSPFYNLEPAHAAAVQLGIPLCVVDFTADILALLKSPPHGFGAGLNPCIDCHARMLRRAGELMEREGVHFLATGEVLNERPFSQTRRSLAIVEADSGYAGFVLRPLSAQHLPETVPEQKGWVDRSRLLALEGRNRKPQIELARHYGLTDYPNPAGGCRLTEPNFARRLDDLKRHEGLDDLRAIRLLRVGRHFRLAPDVKLIVGRNQADNEFLDRECADLLRLKVRDIPGPTAVMAGAASAEQVREAATLCARYADALPGTGVRVVALSGGGEQALDVRAADADAFTDRML